MKMTIKPIGILLSVLILISTLAVSPFTVSALENGCTGNCTWILDEDDTLTISGTGAMEDYWWLFKHAPWGKNIRTVIIEDGVTSIGDYAFDGCTNLTSVTIPQSVESIAKYAFYNGNKDKLTIHCDQNSYAYKYAKANNIPFIINDCIWTLDSDATLTISGNGKMESRFFPRGKDIETVEIQEGVTSIDNGAFYEWKSLTHVSIPKSVTHIGDKAFYGCEKLAIITIPERVKSIGNEAFYGCKKLTVVTSYDNVTSIGERAFYQCENLIAFRIPSNETSIGNEAFYKCERLTSITIPERVISIGYRAFYGCSKLESVVILGSKTRIGDKAFKCCSDNLTIQRNDDLYVDCSCG